MEQSEKYDAGELQEQVCRRSVHRILFRIGMAADRAIYERDQAKSAVRPLSGEDKMASRLMPVNLRSQIMPTGTAYRELGEIRRLEASAHGAKTLDGVYGFVDPQFRFLHDHKRDWKPSGSAPRSWRFEGSSLTLQIKPEVLLPIEYENSPNVLVPIKQHEQLRVQDAKTIVSRLLPSRLKNDPTFKSFFVERQPVPDRTYHQMIPRRIAEHVAAVFERLWQRKVSERQTPTTRQSVEDAVQQALLDEQS
jgi:hypothetical protein